MKDRHLFKEHFEMLELTPEADFAEVHKAWQLLKEIYSTESLATMALAGEVSPEERQRLLAEIEASYQVLSAFFHERRHQVADRVNQLTAEISDYDGATLRRLRKELHIPLDDLAMATRVPRQHLENIEGDHYELLPVAVYTRGFVVNYARHLGLDAEKVAASFMDKYRQYLQKD
jgi:hypothetical protein